MTPPSAPPAPPRNHIPLPPTKTLQKRPLQHAPIPPPTARAPQILYISARTPFVAAIKRVESALKAIDAAPPLSKKLKLGKVEDGEGCVTLKGTGRAIDRTLQLATYFMGLGYGVKVRTGSLGVVDDVVELQEGFVKRDRGTGKKRKGKVAEEVEMAGKEEEVEEVEMVARTTSVVEVLIVRKKE